MNNNRHKEKIENELSYWKAYQTLINTEIIKVKNLIMNNYIQ
jgi:hypothetical protein